MQARGAKQYQLIKVLIIVTGIMLGGVRLCPAQGLPVSNYEHGIFSSAKQDFDNRDFARAAATLRKYFDTHPHRHPYAYELYGHILLRTQQASKALDILQEGVEEYPEQMNLVQNLAVAYARTNRPAKAGEAFLQAYALSGYKMPQLAFSAGVYLAKGERYEEATNVISNLISKEGLRPTWALSLAQCHLHRHQEKQAARILEEAVEQFPDNTKLWRMLAYAYLKSDALKKAAAAYEVAFTLEPSSIQESVQLATLFMNLGAANLGATVAKDSSPSMLDNLAYCLAKSGNLEQALQKALEAQQKQPTDERRFRLAQILFRMNRLREAKTHYSALAQSAGPYRNKAQWSLALLAWHAGDWAAASAQLKNIKQTDPKMTRRVAKLLQILENIMAQG